MKITTKQLKQLIREALKEGLFDVKPEDISPAQKRSAKDIAAMMPKDNPMAAAKVLRNSGVKPEEVLPLLDKDFAGAVTKALSSTPPPVPGGNRDTAGALARKAKWKEQGGAKPSTDLMINYQQGVFDQQAKNQGGSAGGMRGSRGIAESSSKAMKLIKILIKEALLKEYERYESGGRYYNDEESPEVLYYFDHRDQKLKYTDSQKPVDPNDYDLADEYNTSDYHDWLMTQTGGL